MAHYASVCERKRSYCHTGSQRAWDFKFPSKDKLLMIWGPPILLHLFLKVYRFSVSLSWGPRSNKRIIKQVRPHPNTWMQYASSRSRSYPAGLIQESVIFKPWTTVHICTCPLSLFVGLWILGKALSFTYICVHSPTYGGSSTTQHILLQVWFHPDVGGKSFLEGVDEQTESGCLLMGKAEPSDVVNSLSTKYGQFQIPQRHDWEID